VPETMALAAALPALLEVAACVIACASACSSLSVAHARAQIAALERFHIVVPLAVVAALDGLKHGDQRVHKGARAAVRALQDAMGRARPHLRVQLAHESLAAAGPDGTLAPAAGPASQPAGEDRVAVLACARFFMRQGGGVSGVVAVLSNDETLATAVRFLCVVYAQYRADPLS
jgi:hypothetical protein